MGKRIVRVPPLQHVQTWRCLLVKHIVKGALVIASTNENYLNNRSPKTSTSRAVGIGKLGRATQEL